MHQKYLLAIEIGSSKVKGAVGILDDGALSVVAIEEERILDSVRHGLISNVENVSTRINSIVRKLQNRVSPRKAESVYISIGGRSFRSAPREVVRQLPMEEMITAELIDQLRSEAMSTALSDREVVAVADGEYYVDQHLCPNPVGTYGRHIKATFNLVTCRNNALRNVKRAITERLNLKINKSFVRQTAEAELVLSSDERLQGCMLVDFGAETTTVSIYKNGALRYMATLPMGSRNITRDIMTFNSLEERAEEIKKAGSNAMPQANPSKEIIDGIDFSEINKYVAARASEIVANINEQLHYAGLSPADLSAGVVLVGGGAKLKNFCELVTKMTKMKARLGIPSHMVRITDGRIPAFDSIDVISILNAAAKSPECAECMVDYSQPAPAPVIEQPVVGSGAVPSRPASVGVQANTALGEGSGAQPSSSQEPVIDETKEREEAVSSILDEGDPIDEIDKPRKQRRGATWFKNLTKRVTEILQDPVNEDDLVEDEDGN